MREEVASSTRMWDEVFTDDFGVRRRWRQPHCGVTTTDTGTYWRGHRRRNGCHIIFELIGGSYISQYDEVSGSDRKTATYGAYRQRRHAQFYLHGHCDCIGHSYNSNIILRRFTWDRRQSAYRWHCGAVRLELDSIRLVADFIPLEHGGADVILRIKWLQTLGKWALCSPLAAQRKWAWSDCILFVIKMERHFGIFLFVWLVGSCFMYYCF